MTEYELQMLAAIADLQSSLNFIFFIGAFLTGICLFRIACLGKNSRNFW